MKLIVFLFFFIRYYKYFSTATKIIVFPVFIWKTEFLVQSAWLTVVYSYNIFWIREKKHYYYIVSALSNILLYSRIYMIIYTCIIHTHTRMSWCWGITYYDIMPSRYLVWVNIYECLRNTNGYQVLILKSTNIITTDLKTL